MEPEFSEDEAFRRFLAEVAASVPLGPAEEDALAEAAVAGDDEARDRLTECLQPLVISIARKYQALTHDGRLIDLVSAGNVGLRRAFRSYDPARGFRFSRYATWWIRQAITRSMQ